MTLAYEVEGKSVLTAEGLVSPDGTPHPVQRAVVEEGAIQCGFCTPGMIIAAYALLCENPSPSDEEIKQRLSGNLCRCTGYAGILRAVRKASELMRAQVGECRVEGACCK
jgi:carbon-monoxide dehydrogenase small subunit